MYIVVEIWGLTTKATELEIVSQSTRDMVACWVPELRCSAEMRKYLKGIEHAR